MKRRLCTYLLSLVALSVQAQLNESDTTLFQLRAGLTGNYQQGNVAVFALRSRLDVTVAPNPAVVFKSQNASLYQAFFDQKADDDLFSRNYLYYKPYRRVYPFVIAYMSTNFRRQIDSRYFAGAGVTFGLWRRPANVLKVAAEAVYEQSRFAGTTFNRDRYSGSRYIDLWRATVWLGGWHHLAARRLRLYYDAFWQPGFADANNYRWQVDVGVDLPVWQGLSVNALYSFTHEQVVLLNVRPNDALLTFGLAYNFRKNDSR